MTIWIGFLRGINVGAHNRLPMAELRGDLASLGFTNISTYIQSGNVVFESESNNAEMIANQITQHLTDHRSIETEIVLLTPQELATAIQRNPFPEANSADKATHFYFMESEPNATDLDALQAIKKDGERFELTERVFFLFAPEGIGRSKLAASVERRLGVPTTARNLRTVTKLLAMAAELE